MKKLLLLLTMLAAVGLHAAGPDEQWEMTSSMEMPGMKMPATKTTFCMAKGGDYNPDKGPDKNCTISDMKSSGNTSRWKMVCTGKNAMEGSGEMTRTPDTMNQTVKMTMGGQTMTMVGVGKRIGSCDAAADKKKMQDQVAGDISKMCAAQLESTYKSGGHEGKMPEMWSRPQQCASSKATLCEKARGHVVNGSYAEYTTYANSKGWVAAECGINVEARRVELCKKAVTEKQNPFIKERCPVEAKVFADDYAKNCQGFGRDYTADLARPNAKQCTALRFWAVKPVKGAAGNSGTGKSATGTVPLERQAQEAPAAKPAKAAADKQTTAEKQAANKSDNPGAALLDSVKGLKDKFKF
jgi:hypothetical protein